MSDPANVFIALGANLGDRAANLREALRRLGERDGIEVVRISSFHETDAVGGPEGSPPFLNAAAELRTTLAPEALLAVLLGIERDLGRVRNQRWEPRLIDLDILLYGDRVIASPELSIPHPLMHQRRFVLAPLAEIAPQAVHPVLRQTIAQLLAKLG